MDELLEMYRQTITGVNFQADKRLLKKNNLTEMKWISFLNLVEELELNEDGIRILLEEIKSGRVGLR